MLLGLERFRKTEGRKLEDKEVSNSVLKVKISLETLNQRSDIKTQN